MQRTAKMTALVLAVLSMLVFPALAYEMSLQQEAPSVRMVRYLGRGIELRYPENWSVSEYGGFIYIAPDGGFVDGSLAYGMMIATFDSQNRDGYDEDSFPSPGSFEETTLASAADQVVAQWREWNQNVGMVLYAGKTRIDG